MSGSVHSLTHGTLGLETAYLLTFAAMLTGLIHGRAPLRHLLMSLFIAAPVLLLTAIVIAIFSPIWTALGVGPTSNLRYLLGAVLSVAVAYAAGRLLAVHAKRTKGALHLRGAVVSASKLGSTRNANDSTGNGSTSKSAGGITLASIPVPPADETKHFKFIGTTGTGKSTAIQEMLSAALARGDRAIIADPDGGYLRRFYDPDRDLILNPFDPDARKWDLFGEITNNYDVEQLARSLIPDHGGQDRVWSGYARTVFSAVLQQAINVNKRNDAELIRLLVHASLKELRLLLPGTSAAPFLEEGNEKMFGSVRAVAASAIDALKYSIRHQAAPLSVRQWVREGAARQNGGRGGVLFFPYKAGEIAALASTISAWMRLGIFEALDQEDGDQRLWFVVDELDALGAIDGLKDALARLRKFGGRCILGFQSIAQVSGTYGKGVAETIVENCGSTLILRCLASERGGTSEFASKLIGQREVIRTTYSKTRRPSEWLPSQTSSEQLRTESAVMASEIERLPDLTGYLKLASIPDWFSVKLTPTSTEAKPRPRRQASDITPPPIHPSPPSQQSPAATTPTSQSSSAPARGAPISAPPTTDVPAHGSITRKRKSRTASLESRSKSKRTPKPQTVIVAPIEPIVVECPASVEAPSSSVSRDAVQIAPGDAESRH